MTDHTLIRTPFGFDSTAAEVVAGLDLTGRRAIVTGGSSGIGIETARALAGAGADVTLAVRDTAAGERAAAAIADSTGSSAPHVQHLDLADLASVAAFADAWSGPLHLLVNNAGVMALPELQRTVSGAELQFATNHLGHFALAVGLHDALAAAGGARIVSLSSLVHMVSPVDFDDPQFERRPYHPVLAYGQSKTANILFAVEATRRWAQDGILANALHPGVILETGLMRHVDPETAAAADGDEAPAYGFKTIEQGAATSAFVAISPLLGGVGGRYFQDCQEAEVVDRDPAEPTLPGSGVASYALDPESAERLWELSTALTRS
jgi:NAD(P)-dependent dehydrogenase (short-subunit alcohol dehydrogenase family)